jgi:hypothetical protein
MDGGLATIMRKKQQAEHPLERAQDGIARGSAHNKITVGPVVLCGVERVRGIEPLYEAWEAAVLPLNYTRSLGRF